MPRIYSNFSEGKKEIAKRMKIADMEAATAKAIVKSIVDKYGFENEQYGDHYEY